MSKTSPFVPTRQQLADAAGALLPDVIAPGLNVLFVGINPGLYSAAIGHHFGRPGNRFWPALHQGGFTPRQYSPFEDHDLLALRLGITNVVPRATARADELAAEEMVAGAAALRRKVRKHRPRFVAFLGVTVYRVGLARPEAKVGRQPDPLDGAITWVLPNPSGLNAHYGLADLATLFAELRLAVEGPA